MGVISMRQRWRYFRRMCLEFRPGSNASDGRGGDVVHVDLIWE